MRGAQGAPYVTNDDSKEKRAVGELRVMKSGRQVLFLMAEQVDAQGQ